jgi:hypothetical protein
MPASIDLDHQARVFPDRIEPAAPLPVLALDLTVRFWQPEGEYARLGSAQLSEVGVIVAGNSGHGLTIAIGPPATQPATKAAT